MFKFYLIDYFLVSIALNLMLLLNIAGKMSMLGVLYGYIGLIVVIIITKIVSYNRFFHGGKK